MQRNHQASALLRLCHQTPNWWNVGGRPNAYSIEWLQQGSTSDWYLKSVASFPSYFTISFWFKVPEVAVGGSIGLFDAPISGAASAFSFDVHHNATSGKNDIRGAVNGTIQTPIEFSANQWTFGYIGFDGAQYTFAVNDGQFPVVAHVGTTNIIGYRIGKTSVGDFLPANSYVDEIAILNDNGQSWTDIVTLYNNGIPLGYSNTYPSLEGTYEVERSVGAISANAIGPRFYPSGTPSSFVWSGGSGVVAVSTDALASVGYSAYIEMAKKTKAFLEGTGTDTAIGTNRDVSLLAGGLMPYPAGRGFNTIVEVVSQPTPFVGESLVPHASPLLGKVGTVGSNGDSTSYPANGGTGSLQDVVDSRASVLFTGPFVKKP
jgi:hypothetical protein